MLRLLAPLFGFAVFGALFAGLYYEPENIERDIGPPKFRLGPGEAKPDFIEPGAFGENVSVNVAVLSGGPIDVLLVDMENSTFVYLNSTLYGFEFRNETSGINTTFSSRNITDQYNFTFTVDGENRWALFFVSRVQPPSDWENLTDEEQETYVTEVFVNMRYIDAEEKSLIFGYILAAPSVLLVGYALYAKARKPDPDEAPDEPPYRYPEDRGL